VEYKIIIKFKSSGEQNWIRLEFFKRKDKTLKIKVSDFIKIVLNSK